MVRLAPGAQGLRIGRPRGYMRYVLLVVGGLMALVGGVWILQGVGLLPGSFMTGRLFWAVAGAIMLVVAGILAFVGVRPD